MKKPLILWLLCFYVLGLMAEDGSQLWLRHGRETVVPAAPMLLDASSCSPADSATALLALDELLGHWSGDPVQLVLTVDGPAGAGAYRIEKLPADSIGLAQGYDSRFLLTASSAQGLLYGAYFMLRAQSRADVCLCNTLPPSHVLEQRPAVALRCLEGQDVVFDLLRQGRVADYARACASVGINGVVVRQRRSPSRTYINKVEQLRSLLAPYGISIYTADSMPQPVVHLPEAADDQPFYHLLAPSWAQMLHGGVGESCVAASVYVGDNHHWCADGQLFAQFDWFAAGRLMWQPDLPLEQLAYEWLADTFTENPLFVLPLRHALMQCDGTAEGAQSLLNAWRDAAASVDEERFGLVEKALCDQLDGQKN